MSSQNKTPRGCQWFNGPRATLDLWIQDSHFSVTERFSQGKQKRTDEILKLFLGSEKITYS